MADARKLARIGRVRALQEVLARADEARAEARHATEAALHDRVARLAEEVAPRPATTAAAALVAAAHYRDRLARSAAAAAARVLDAEAGVAHARDATREARRDRTAVDKLIDRARADAARRERRAMEDAPPPRRPNRHDPC